MIFNDYINDVRTNIAGCRSTRMQDEAILRNVRFRFPELTRDWSDQKVVNMYDEFAMTEMFGNNDERFPEFVAESDQS